MNMNTPDGFQLMNWNTDYGGWLAKPDWATLRIGYYRKHFEGPQAALKTSMEEILRREKELQDGTSEPASVELLK